MPQLTLPRPKLALQNAASLPRQVLPTAIGRPLSSALSNLTDSLPDIALPASFPTPPLPQGLAQGFGNIPGPRQFVARAETVLPAGLPRLASFVPDLRFTKGVGVTMSDQGQFRPLQKTSTASNGRVRAGGYRSI